MIRTTMNNTSYDVVFMPPDREHFIRSNPPTTEPETEDEILEGDLNTIEDFFAHFHDGIKMRMEEASARFVK